MDRRLRGTIVLPAEAPAVQYACVRVEVRDVSFADAPSVVVASTEIKNVSLSPGDRLPFDLTVPEVAASHALSVRVHATQDGSTVTKCGDLISMASYPVSAAGSVTPLEIPIRLVR